MYRVALFDIDGTLCDPGGGITSAVRHALAELGIAEVDEAALRRFVGPPLEHSFRDHYALGPVEVDAAVQHYRRHYRDHGLGEYRAYPGIRDLLERLTARGVRLGVVTAKLQVFGEEALRRTGLTPYFDTVSGRAADEVVTKTVTLGKALDRMAEPRASVVMVGDREHDVIAATENGIDSVGVLYGYGTRAELTAAGATHLAADAGDVERLVLGSRDGAGS
jgi:phosphoglycolate phosphatase